MSEPAPVHGLRLRPFAVADAELVEPWLRGPGLSVPAGQAGRQWAARMVADPRILARTGLLGGAPVAFARLHTGPDRSAELTLAVADAYRRRGIGRQMLLQLLEEARRNGLLEIRALVDLANVPAYNLFTKNGFEQSGPLLGSCVRLLRRLHQATSAPPLEIEV